MAEDAWNTRDSARVVRVYTEDTRDTDQLMVLHEGELDAQRRFGAEGYWNDHNPGMIQDRLAPLGRRSWKSRPSSSSPRQMMEDDIRLALNQNQPLGNSRFYTKIEAMTGQQREAKPRGRPRAQRDESPAHDAGQGELGL